MKQPTETKSFTITTSPTMMRRLERFLAMLHFNSGFGHSGLFAMPLDGDGNEKIKVEPIDKNLAFQVSATGGIGYDVEVAMDGMYSGKFLDGKSHSYWSVKPSKIEGAAEIYRDGVFVRTIPHS